MNGLQSRGRIFQRLDYQFDYFCRWRLFRSLVVGQFFHDTNLGRRSRCEHFGIESSNPLFNSAEDMVVPILDIVVASTREHFRNSRPLGTLDAMQIE